MKKFLLLCSFVFVAGIVLAQERVVTGRVTAAEDGSPLPGVNVVVKGTTNGTVTDANGSYSVSVPSNGTTLVFSFIGLQTQEVTIGDKSVVDIGLTLDVQQLSEVVVTGTGVATEKRKLAIAVETVTAAQLPIAPTGSLDQALVGKVAGAQIQSISGVPGADINILLRGINTINRGTGPMILVDGVQLGVTSLNSLDLTQVERVEIIQGAAAGTIYGAQGANGVIQVFTKRGKEGQLDINFSTSIATNQYLNIGGLTKANLHGFATDGSNNVIGSSGNPLTQDPNTLVYSENLIWDSTNPSLKIDKPYNANLQYHDHIKEFFVPANTTNNNVSISGAKGNVDFNFAATNNHQQSNFKGDGYNDRSNMTANVGIQLAKGLKLRSITQLIYTKNTIDIYNKQDFGVNSLVYGIFNARPFVDYSARTASGDYAYYYGDASGVNQTNPNYTLWYNDTKDLKTDINQNFNLNYEFPKFVTVDLKYGINHQDRNVRYKALNQSDNANSNNQAAWVGWYNGADNTGEILNFNYSQTFQNFLGNVTAKFDFDKDFKMGIPLRTITQAAYDYRNNNLHQYYTYGLGIPLDPPQTAVQAKTFKTAWDYTEPFITYGYLVNQRFEWGEIATVSAGFRSDYSSAFGQGHKPFTFPRADGSFRVSSLNFWNDSGIGNAIIEWKLRAAYGQAGIQPKPFDRFPTLTSKTVGSSATTYLGPTQSNPALNVEVSTETELGTDITLDAFKGNWLSNVNISFTYWKRSTDNAIFGLESAPTTGVGKILDNSFAISSKGIQASLNANVLKAGNFNWNLTTNFSRQSSQIDGVTGNGQVVVTSNAGSTNYVLKAGDKIGQLYGFMMIHDVNAIDPATGTPFIAPSDQSQYSVASNGWVVNNATKAPYVSPNQYSFGNPYPKFNMSFINDFSYKNFLTAGVQFDWVQGNHLYNQTKEWMYRDGIHGDYTQQITINGESAAWSAFYRGVYAEVSRNGTKNYFYEDASFVRLRNVYVAIDFAKLFNIPKMKKLQLVLTGRNLATWTKYTGMDPEISSGTVNSAWDRGTDHNTLPNFKTYQGTLNIGF